MSSLPDGRCRGTGPSSPDLTVIVATRNRARQTAQILRHLASQETDGILGYEVLVVDNGSTDTTRLAVEAEQRGFPAGLHYVYEGRTGKSYALNAGMAWAAGNILVFTDDDARPDSRWLVTLAACFREEEADAVSGRVLPHWVAPPPPWLTDEAFRRIGALGCVDHGSRRLHSSHGGECRWVGSNLAIRRAAAQRVGKFDERLQRGQDTDYYRRALAAGLEVVYEPAAVVHHEIPPERLTKAYFRRWYHRAGSYRGAYVMPWSLEHLVTIMPLARYQRMVTSAIYWLGGTLCRREPWWKRFKCELLVREDLSIWWCRFQLLPRWWLTVLTGRSFMP